MPTNRDGWVPYARRFVATGRSQYLQDAVSNCEDTVVRDFLAQCELGEPAQSVWEVSAALVAQSRGQEAGLIEILGLRRRAYDLLFAVGGPLRSYLREALEILIELSNRHGFAECEAAFHAALGMDLSKAGLNAAAAEHLTRAADLYRPLVADEPDVYQAELASSLQSLGITLFQMALYSASENAYRESLAHWESVDAGTGGANRINVSNVFNNLGNTLKALRRLAEAEESLRRALDIRRALAREDGPRYEEFVATTLNNLGNVLREKRLFDDALAVLEEALEIRTRLAEKDPGRFTVARVTTLKNIAAVYNEQREFERARQELELAVSLLEESSVHPTRKANELLGLRLNLGIMSRKEGRWDEAIEHLRQVEQAYREPGEKGRGTNLDALSKALQELAEARLGKGDVPAAKAHLQEALSLRNELARLDPGGHRKEMADCLVSYGLVLEAAQESKEAAETFKRAADLFEALNREEPGSHATDLALALGNLTLALVADGGAAWETTCESAVRIAEQAETTSDSRWLSKGRAGGCYSLLAQASMNAGNTDKAFRCLAALRRPDARAISGEECDLGRAAATLRRIEDQVGRKILVVIAHRMSAGSTGSLLGLLQSSPPCFQLEHDEGFQTNAFMLLQEVGSAFEADDKRPFSVRYEAFNRRSADAWASAPRLLKDALLTDRDTDVLISGDPFWNAFPWDALKPDDGEGGWIGQNRVFTRWYDVTPSGLSRLQPRTLGERQRSAAIVCPWNADAQRPLPRARDEAEGVSAMFLQRGYLLLPEGSALVGEHACAGRLRDLIAAAPTVLHFTGHGATSRNEQALVLWNDQGTSSALLSRRRIALSRSRAAPAPLEPEGGLVVLNSCLSGSEKGFGGQREDLPSAFLEAGATAVVSSQFPISDVLGSAFGQALYERASEPNETLSRAFCRARALMEGTGRKRRSPYWASWSVFTYTGNPYVMLPR